MIFMKETALFLLILPGIICLSSEEMSDTEETSVFQKTAESYSLFSNDFYKLLADELDDDIIVSPFSLYMTLSLLQHGAKGLTFDELQAVLYTNDNDISNEETKSLISVFNDIKNVDLQIANAIYMQEGAQISSDFLSLGTDIFNCGLFRTDFSNKEQAINEINTWVKNATKNKIPTVLAADDINDNVRIILLNAVYFKGQWLHKFNERLTQNKSFYKTKWKKISVPMMYIEEKYVYGEIPKLDTRFIELPYLNEDIAMIILLPNKLDGIKLLEKDFKWDDYLNASSRETQLKLNLPRFKYKATINLRDILEKMGLYTMFQDNADFSRLINEKVRVSKVLQKAFIEVNEEGSVAAAATVAQIRVRRAIIETVEEFLVDHPFLFIICHKPSKIPIFLGSVKNTQTSKDKDEL